MQVEVIVRRTSVSHEDIGSPIRFSIDVSDFSYGKLAKALKLDEHAVARMRDGDAGPEENLRRALAFNLRDRMLALIKKLGEYTVHGI